MHKINKDCLTSNASAPGCWSYHIFLIILILLLHADDIILWLDLGRSLLRIIPWLRLVDRLLVALLIHVRPVLARGRRSDGILRGRRLRLLVVRKVVRRKSGETLCLVHGRSLTGVFILDNIRPSTMAATEPFIHCSQ